MLKEINEQPDAVRHTMENRISFEKLHSSAFGEGSQTVFEKIKRIHLVACGTSYHAALIGKIWLEEIAGLPASAEIASENRYLKHVIEADSLFVVLSQSGETADTLAAIRQAKESGYLATLAICNVPESSIMREADFTFLTDAGPEIAVASTKAFTTQMTALMLLTINMLHLHHPDEAKEKSLLAMLRSIPNKLYETLLIDKEIQAAANQLVNRQNALYIGRGIELPVAMEGALKLKEISYIHAEAYAAGELKHGPIALIDNEMTTITLAPSDDLLDKVKSNMQEIMARNGQLIIFTDSEAPIEKNKNISIIHLPKLPRLFAPFAYATAMQLLAYHVAVLKKTDVDQPRNLAKSVTVE
jgi:glucosamine--fructose-6-phosphate aminotransferase (isomerizing)